jgi:hypothetical protein
MPSEAARQAPTRTELGKAEEGLLDRQTETETVTDAPVRQYKALLSSKPIPSCHHAWHRLHRRSLDLHVLNAGRSRDMRAWLTTDHVRRYSTSTTREYRQGRKPVYKNADQDKR